MGEKNLLERIKDEVKDLHPILDIILRKFPRIKNVEYNHGTDEFGADFVLSREDETFNNLEYIGVIAKVGKIGQDISPINRQIEECNVPRFFMNGKESINITEIWVVTTGLITSNAQRMIHQNYSNRKIVFIDGKHLEELINRYHPSFWTDLPLRIGEYLSNLRSKNEELDKNLSLIQSPSGKFYINQDIFENSISDFSSSSKRIRRKKINIHEKISSSKLIIIEGGAGSGKSKLVRQLIDYYTTGEVFLKYKFLPIYATYREFFDDYESDINKLINKKVDSKVQEELVLIDNYKYLLFVDGIDEKKFDPEEQNQALSKLIDDINKLDKVKGVFTTRYLAGIDKLIGMYSALEKLELAPLSMDQTIEFITCLCTQLNLKNRIIEDLKKSQLFRDLPRNPIAAILLAKLLNENSKEIPSNLTELYSQYSELILGRWDIDKGLQSLKEYQAIDNILMEYAKSFIDYEMPYLTISDAKDMVEDYLRQRNLGIDKDRLFERICYRCDLITFDNHKRVIYFKHHTFAEFFYAKYHLGKSFEINSKAFDIYWTNTIFFFIGLLKDCPEIINGLANYTPQNESERWLKIINMGNYLLAAFTTPYISISTAIYKVFVEAAELYRQIIFGEIDSPFLQISQMNLLFLIQYIIRNNYSYEFFIKAIEDSALEITYSEDKPKNKAYQLYFLNVAYIDTNSTDNLDLLLKNDSIEISLDLSLAIYNEGEKNKERSELMKKSDKHIKKLLRGNSSANSQLDKLYKTPLNKIIEKKL